MAATTKEFIASKLRSFPMFADLASEDLDVLAGLIGYREFPKGTFLISQHDRGNVMYLLLSGRVKVSLASPEGKELALNYLEPPSYVGEMSIVDSEPRCADVIAVSDVEALSLEAKDLARAFQLQPRIAIALISTMSRRIRGLITRLQDMAFHDATHRVMRVLLNVATASYEARGVPLVEGLTHYEIATLAGTSRETASRVISNLSRDGALATKGRKIVVDLFALRDQLEHA